MAIERPGTFPEDPAANARDRAKRLADDLSTDAAELKSVAAKCLDDQQRAEGEALLGAAAQAAMRLGDALARQN